jgi:hypothetical protein
VLVIEVFVDGILEEGEEILEGEELRVVLGVLEILAVLHDELDDNESVTINKVNAKIIIITNIVIIIVIAITRKRGIISFYL